MKLLELISWWLHKYKNELFLVVKILFNFHNFCLASSYFNSINWILFVVQSFKSCPTPCDPMDCSRQHAASLSFSISQSLLKLMSIDSVTSSDHLILCCLLLLLPSVFPRVFSNELVFSSGGQSIGASASTSVLPMNIQNRFSLGLTSLISLQSKWLNSLLQHNSKASALRHSAFFMVQLSHSYMTPGKNIALTIWIFVSKVMPAF